VFDRRWRFPESFDVGDVTVPDAMRVPNVTVTASGVEQLLIGLRARHYTAWSEGKPADGFHLYIAGGQIHAWTGDAMDPRHRAIREAAAAALRAFDGAAT